MRRGANRGTGTAIRSGSTGSAPRSGDAEARAEVLDTATNREASRNAQRKPARSARSRCMRELARAGTAEEERAAPQRERVAHDSSRSARRPRHRAAVTARDTSAACEPAARRRLANGPSCGRDGDAQPRMRGASRARYRAPREARSSRRDRARRTARRVVASDRRCRDGG